MKFKTLLLAIMCAGTVVMSEVPTRCKRSETGDRKKEITSAFCTWYKMIIDARHQRVFVGNISKDSRNTEDVKFANLDKNIREKRFAYFGDVFRPYQYISSYPKRKHIPVLDSKTYQRKLLNVKRFPYRNPKGIYHRVKRQIEYESPGEVDTHNNDTSLDFDFWDSFFVDVPDTNTERTMTELSFVPDHSNAIAESANQISPSFRNLESHESRGYQDQESSASVIEQTILKPSLVSTNKHVAGSEIVHDSRNNRLVDVKSVPESNTSISDSGLSTDNDYHLEHDSALALGAEFRTDNLALEQHLNDTEVPEESNYEEEAFEFTEETKHRNQQEVINNDAEKQTSFWLKSMYGIPGLNFPNYHDIPLTSFTCSKKRLPGFYADMESACQVFHVCYQNRRESFLCPVGTVFNQAVLTCDFWYRSNCSLTNYYIQTEKEVFPPEDKPSLESTTSKPASETSIENILLSSTPTYLESSSPANDSTSATSVLISNKQKPITELKNFSKFLPIKAKVTIYPATGDKRAKVEAVASIGHRTRGRKRRPTVPVLPQKTSVRASQNGIDPEVNKIIKDAFEIARQVLEEAGSLFPPRRPSTRTPKVVPTTVGSRRPAIPKSLPTLNPRFIIQPVYPKKDDQKSSQPAAYLLDDHFEIRKE